MKDQSLKEGPESRKGYANLLCDFMFKRLFGSEANKDVLIAFLNMVLEDADIVGVDFITTEHLGLTEEDRKVIFDISCRCGDGRTFIIEMQNGYQRYFRERALYYTTYPINDQGRSARERFLKMHAESGAKFKWDYDLKPVIVVAILNFRFDHVADWPAERYHSSYRLLEDHTYEPMTDALRFVFLELGRFKKQVWELETMYEKWLYLLRHMHELEVVPEKFTDPLFRRLFLLAEIGKFTPSEYEQYAKSLENMGDYLNIINTAAEDAEKRGLEKGRSEGRAEGLAEGRAEAQHEMARKFKSLGVAIETIVEATGLDRETVEAM